jgi:hypothetical protein
LQLYINHKALIALYENSSHQFWPQHIIALTFLTTTNKEDGTA